MVLGRFWDKNAAATGDAIQRAHFTVGRHDAEGEYGDSTDLTDQGNIYVHYEGFLSPSEFEEFSLSKCRYFRTTDKVDKKTPMTEEQGEAEDDE